MPPAPPFAIKDLKPRAYQEAIAETAKKRSSLVVLPTGLGKTAISLIVAADRLSKFPESQILLLAPTRPLASQHYSTFKKHFAGLEEEDFSLVTGEISQKKREGIWRAATIIFSTPQCVANDVRAGKLSLENFSFLIEDEAHRCIKNYDYTYVVKAYREQASRALVLGLTASPGSEQARINQICKNLGIEAVEVRTRESEDVKRYIKELKTNVIKVGFPSRFVEIKERLNKILAKRVEELRNRGLLYGKFATKRTFIELQAKLMRISKGGNKHFHILRGISLLTEIMKAQHLLELLETQTVYSVNKYLEGLEKEEKEAKSKAIKNLFGNVEFQLAITKIKKLVESGTEHPKLRVLLDVVKTEIKSGNKRMMIFAQYRDTVDKIHSELDKAGISSRIFIGQSGERGLKQREQQQVLREFSEGEISCLVSTSIGEEGLDIPEVGAVIFYEPIPSAIRRIQRAGRTARLQPGKLIMLITQKTRDESYHWASYYKERKMHGILRDMKDDFDRKEEERQSKMQKSLGEF